jgi:hypothetical protein
MRRCIIYAAIMAVVLAIPLERTDVADLHPVQTVALYKTRGGYRIETDTEDFGVGVSVDAAFKDLIDTTPGVIYLDTADYLLVSEEAKPGVEQMRQYLKNGVRICQTVGQGDLKAVTQYLSVQRGLQPLNKWKSGQQLPVLDCRTDHIKFL